MGKEKKKERYSRINQLAALRGTSAKAFQEKPMAVIGVGNLGGQVAYHLALMGFPIIVVDSGRVEEANLGTQGFSRKHLGRAKTEARAEILHECNPDCNIKALNEDISILGPGHFLGVQALFSCLDSWLARSVVHEIAWALGIPLVDGGLDGSGERFYGRVAVYDPRQKESPCMFCSWDQESLRAVRRRDRGSRTACPEFRLGSGAPDANPTLMPSSMGAVIAGMQVIQALKLLFDEKETQVCGQEILMDLSSNRFSSVQLKQNPNCIFPHERWPLKALDKNTAQLSVWDLFYLATEHLGSKVELSLHRKHLATQLKCENGHVCDEIFKIAETFPEENTRCNVSKCTKRLAPVKQGLMSRFDLEKALSFSDRTWKSLGLPDKDLVTARNGERGVRFVFS
ncbi:MAG: ThiF family adenylyltransferase [bacterium]